jgi:hypothetical protein
MKMEFEISHRDTAAFVAGVGVWNALRLDEVKALSIDRPLDIWVDYKRSIDAWIDAFDTEPHKATPILTGYFCGAIARRKYGDRDIHFGNILQRLETSRVLFPVAAKAQKFCREMNLVKIRLLTNTLCVDRVVSAAQVEFILGVSKRAA